MHFGPRKEEIGAAAVHEGCDNVCKAPIARGRTRNSPRGNHARPLVY